MRGANVRVKSAYDELTTTLGSPEFWSALRVHTDSMSPADTKDLAKRFTGMKTIVSKGSAIKQISARQRKAERGES